MGKLKDGSKYTVFFDFDNTITSYDVLDDILVRFGADDRWKKIEDQWQNGKIGSRECLREQIKSIRVDRSSFDRYLSKVPIDPYFKRTLKLLSSRKIDTFILSDNFDYILKRVLKKNGLSDFKNIYSNSMRLKDGKFSIRFPHSNNKCGDCAHCKKTTLSKKAAKDSVSIYIGDGRSDVCVSRGADIVLAKAYLKKYCADNDISHIPFKDLKDVYQYFQRSLR